jgi:hypothetical protein
MILLLLPAIVLLWACNSSPKQAQGNADNEEVYETKEKLPSLEGGEVSYKNKELFGKLITLTGQQLFNDSVIFKVRETEMMVRDNQFLVYNRGERPFMQYRLPDLQFIGYGNGIMGQGPDEFLFPHLVPTVDTSILCYIFESTNQKLYKFHKSGEITYYPVSFSDSKHHQYSDKKLINIGIDDFMYVETSDTGKSIFRITTTGDSCKIKEVYNLGLNPKRKSWTSYIGDFVANPERNRMAYAYKYFKIIKFMDLDAQTVKTINFEREEFDEGSEYEVDGLDQNITHYWGACAGKDYVYFLYSGRTPHDAMRENQKGQYYIFVEQYDWNGNPVCQYKLDRYGYFTVDEKNKMIYLASVNDDDPFFMFKMQD